MKYCKNCAWADKEICRLHDMPIDREKDHCAKGTANVGQCMVCKRMVINYILDLTTGEPRIFCENCFQKLKTCANCDHAQTCYFESDPNPTPKYTIVNTPLGQAQSKNPARIKVTCAQHCPCFDSENQVCNRENSFCKNLRQIL